MRYKAVIFDLDGVLVTTDHYHYLAWKRMAEQYGIHFDQTINERLKGVSRMKSLNIILEQSEKQFTEDEKVNMAEYKNNVYKDYLKNLSEHDLLDNVKKTLLMLKEKGIKIAIGSSSKNTKFILHQIGIYDMFDGISDGSQAQYSKPHPEIFMNAAMMIDVPCEECLVIEDAEAGCIAAKSAGMDVAGISSANTSKYADYHIENMIEVLALLDD